MKTIKTIFILCMAIICGAQAQQRVALTQTTSLSKNRYERFMNDTSAMKGATVLMLYKQKPDSAIFFAKKLMTKDMSAQNVLLLSNAYLMKGVCDSALVYAKAAHQISATTFYLNALAFKHHECGKSAEAIALFRQSIQQDGSQQDVTDILIDLELSAGNHADSLQAIARINGQIPMDSTGIYRLRLAALLMDRQKEGDAIGVLNSLLRNNPAHKKALLLKASANLREANLDSALFALDQYLKYHAQNDTVWHFHGRLLTEKGDTISAIRSLDMAIQLNSKQPLYYQSVMALLQGYGKTEEQILYARLAHDNNIIDFDYLIAEFEEAVKQVDIQLEAAPALDARTKLAKAYFTLGRYGNAITESMQILQSNPGDTSALYMLTYSYMVLRDFTTASRYAQTLLTASAPTAERHMLMANIQYREGKGEEAIVSAKNAIAIDPRPEFKYFLLSLYYKYDPAAFRKLLDELNGN